MNTYTIKHAAMGSSNLTKMGLDYLFKEVYGDAPKEGGMAVGEFKKQVWGEGILGGKNKFKGMSFDYKKLLKNRADREAVLKAIFTFAYKPDSHGKQSVGNRRLRAVAYTSNEYLNKFMRDAVVASGHDFGKATRLTLYGRTAAEYFEKYCQDPVLRDRALLILENRPHSNMAPEKMRIEAKKLRKEKGLKEDAIVR